MDEDVKKALALTDQLNNGVLEIHKELQEIVGLFQEYLNLIVTMTEKKYDDNSSKGNQDEHLRP